MTEADAVVAGLSGVRAFSLKGEIGPRGFIWDGKRGWWMYNHGVHRSSLTLSMFMNAYSSHVEIDVPDWWWSSKHHGKENQF